MSTNEARNRLAAARRLVDGLDLARFAGLATPRVSAPERLGEVDDIRGGVVAQAYAAMSGPSAGTVPVATARAIEAGARLIASGVAGLYVPPWVGGGGRIVWNVPLIAVLMGREEPADRDAVATLVVAHERVHHIQHGAEPWQREFLALVGDVATSGERPDRTLLAQANATMSVVEGHASVVERDVVEAIHGAGTWWRIRGRHLDRRLAGLLGVVLSAMFASKRDQYKRGMLFCADVADLVPDPYLHLFDRFGGMPVPSELAEPAGWARRIAA